MPTTSVTYNCQIQTMSDVFLTMNKTQRKLMIDSAMPAVNNRIAIEPVVGQALLVTAILKYQELKQAKASGLSLSVFFDKKQDVKDIAVFVDTVNADLAKAKLPLLSVNDKQGFIFQMREGRIQYTSETAVISAELAAALKIQ
jgi:hypothetical protein